MKRTRRSLLKASGVSSVALLGGCLRFGGDGAATTEEASGDGNADGDGGSGDDGSSSSDGTETPTPTETATATPAGDRPAYSEWLVAPSAVPIEEVEHYRFGALKPSEFEAHRDSLPTDTANAVEDFTREFLGVGPGEVDRAAFLGDGFGYGFSGSFTTDAVLSADRNQGLEQSGTYRDFAVYATTEGDNRRRIALREGEAIIAQLHTSIEVDIQSWLETLVDTKVGEGTRYAEANPDCAALLDGVGDGDLVFGRTMPVQESGDLTGRVGDISRWRLGSDATEFKSVIVYESADAAAVQPVERMAKSGAAESFFDAYGDISVSKSGRTVALTATVLTGNVEQLSPPWPAPGSTDGGGGGGSDVPQISFTFDYTETGGSEGYLDVTHQGGDSVPAEELSIRGSGFADTSDATDETIHLTEPGPWPSSQTNEDGNVVAGISVRVGVKSDAEVHVVWESPDSDRSATLALWTGPDA